MHTPLRGPLITAMILLLLGACGQPEPISVSLPAPTDLDAIRFPGPAALLFDGENIWMTKEGRPYRPGAVNKLRASDGKVLGSFTVGRSPNALAFDGVNIWVYNEGDGTLTKLRASDGEILGTFQTGSGSGSYGDSRGLLFDGQHIWVAYSITQRLVQVRASDGKVLRTLRFDASPSAVATEGDTLFRLDLSPRAMTFDGEHIWVANGNQENLAKLRASDGEPIKSVSVNGFPSALAFDGEHIWVANASKETVAKIRKGDGSLVESYSPGGPDVSFAAGSIWVATRDPEYVTIFKYDPAGTVSAAYRIQHPSNTFVAGEVITDFAFDGESLWMALADSRDVIKVAIPPVEEGSP